jgi:hypothetical protein
MEGPGMHTRTGGIPPYHTAVVDLMKLSNILIYFGTGYVIGVVLTLKTE